MTALVTFYDIPEEIFWTVGTLWVFGLRVEQHKAELEAEVKLIKRWTCIPNTIVLFCTKTGSSEFLKLYAVVVLHRQYHCSGRPYC